MQILEGTLWPSESLNRSFRSKERTNELLKRPLISKDIIYERSFLDISSALCLLSLGDLYSLAGFSKASIYSSVHGRQTSLYFLVLVGTFTSILFVYYHLKMIKLLVMGWNQEIIPHMWIYRKYPLRSNNFIEWNMTIRGISSNPVLVISGDTLASS